MPNPRRKNEPTEAFIARCMDEIRDEYPDNSQRYAVCKSYSEKSSEKMKKQDLYVVVPRKAENRGKYLSRCSAHPKMKEQFGDLKERLGYCLTSFNEYYKYWAKLEQFAKVPEDTALGACIAKEKAKGFDYKEAYAHCASKVVVQPQGGTNPVVMSDDNLLVEPVLGDECPPETQDIKLNLANRQKAIEEANYGPQNPNEPNEAYWKKKADMFQGDVEDAKKALCGNCAFFNQTEKILDCIAEGIGGEDAWDTIEAGNLGYCEAFDFKCAAKRTCDAWVVGGPITTPSDEFADLEDACWEGYEPVGLKDNGDGRMVPNCVPVKMTKNDFAETINDYPEAVKNAAKRALNYADKNGWGSCGTGVGKKRANQLANGENISVDTIKRMYSYLSRHKSDLTSSKEYGDGCGKLMYDSWGGEAALKWSEKKLEQLQK